MKTIMTKKSHKYWAALIFTKIIGQTLKELHAFQSVFDLFYDLFFLYFDLAAG